MWASRPEERWSAAAFLLPWVVYPMAADNDFIPKTGSLNVYHFNSTTRSIVGRSGRRGTPGLQAEEPADADPTAYEV